MKLDNVMLVMIVVLGAACLLAGNAHAIIVDLDGLPVGTIVAGETPSGDVLTAGLFEDFELGVDNHGDGPNSLVVIEAVVLDAHPDGQQQTPEYADHLMVIAQNIVDDRPGDGRVDFPICDKEGGLVTFTFLSPVNLAYVVLGALDQDHHDYELRVDGEIAVSVSNGSQWTEPGIFIDLDGYMSISEVTIQLRGGIGIARIAYFPESVDADASTWGAVKVLYR